MTPRNQSRYPRIFLDALWDLHSHGGRSLEELADALRIDAPKLRMSFTKAGYDAWTEAELREMHARHLSGEFISKMASARRKSAPDLISAWRSIGLEPLVRQYKGVTYKRLDQLVAQMHADHVAGATLADLGRKYERDSSTIRTLFMRRGLEIISRQPGRHRPDGTFAPFVPMTEAEIDALVDSATAIVVPEPLKLEWRKWDLARRGEFIARLRARLASEKDRPELPFSRNVKPFDYASPEAWEILGKLNAGIPSRHARSKIDIRSQGVIFGGELWFWSFKGRGYFRCGGWTPEGGRPSLHHHIWTLANGPVPHGWVLSFRDGNPNNLTLSNLALLTRNDICRSNQAKALHRKSVEKMNILLARSKRKTTPKNDLIDHLRTQA